ncbi:hypothetical protein DAI22_07g067600 [Oryza sativa Japonica Group]|nr:hypothetical protein DAI22_07g067600 [Oryza sativa Japonica Group]
MQRLRFNSAEIHHHFHSEDPGLFIPAPRPWAVGRLLPRWPAWPSVEQSVSNSSS